MVFGCLECGEPTSDTAGACPHCGAKDPLRVTPQRVATIIAYRKRLVDGVADKTSVEARLHQATEWAKCLDARGYGAEGLDWWKDPQIEAEVEAHKGDCRFLDKHFKRQGILSVICWVIIVAVFVGLVFAAFNV